MLFLTLAKCFEIKKFNFVNFDAIKLPRKIKIFFKCLASF